MLMWDDHRARIRIPCCTFLNRHGGAQKRGGCQYSAIFRGCGKRAFQRRPQIGMGGVLKPRMSKTKFGVKSRFRSLRRVRRGRKFGAQGRSSAPTAEEPRAPRKSASSDGPQVPIGNGTCGPSERSDFHGTCGSSAAGTELPHCAEVLGRLGDGCPRTESSRTEVEAQSGADVVPALHSVPGRLAVAVTPPPVVTCGLG